MEPPPTRKFRTTKDILIPAGTNVVYVARMKQDVVRMRTGDRQGGTAPALRMADAFR